MAEPLRRRLRARALEALTRAGAWLPGRSLTPLLGALAWAARHGVAGRMARTNLRAALGAELDEAALARLELALFRHGARILGEWLELARGASTVGRDRGAWIDERVTLDPSLAILERERTRGRGLILVTAHIGNWELLAARLRRLGYDGAVVGRQRAADESARWLVRMREAHGVRTLPQDSSARTLLAILRGGDTLGLLCDLEVRRLDGEHLPFFGRPALTMTAPAALARASGAPMIPIRCTSYDGKGYLLQAEEPLALDTSLEREAARRDLLGRLNAVYERWIREQPEQWCWHQDRWRTPPGGYEAVPLVERKRRTRAARGS